MNTEPDKDHSVPEEEPTPKSSAGAELTGLAICICLLVAAFEIGIHSLCGPHGAISYGGGNSTAGGVVLACLLVILASGIGAVVYLVRLLIALGR